MYGANRSLFSLIKYFKDNDYDVNVLLPSNGSMTDKLKEIEVPFTIFPYYSAFLYLRPVAKHLLVPALAVVDLFVFPFLVHKIKKFNPDVIYSNTSAENLGILISKALKVRHIAHIREFMSKDYNSYFILGKKAKQKYIALSDGVITVSKSVLNEVHLKNTPSDKYKTIYNGIAVPSKTIEEKQLPKNPNFGLVGIFDKGKGQHTAIRYFKQILKTYPKAKLHLFGDKECRYKKKLIRLTNDLKLQDSVIFHGFVNSPNQIYQSIDVLFMFSKSEGFGRVTAEAMLYGVPVIGFDNAGTAELIEDRATGCLFNNLETFKESVFYTLKSSELYNEIRIAAFNRGVELFNEFNYCQAVESFLKKTLKNR